MHGLQPSILAALTAAAALPFTSDLPAHPAMTTLSAQNPAGPSLGIEVGEPFPELAFPALDDGQPWSIRDFRGQKVILHVFASW